MKKALFAAPFLVLLLVPLLNWMQNNYGAVPFKRTHFYWGDVSTSTSEKPVATFTIDDVQVAFEGFQYKGQGYGGNYPVDGRHTIWSYWWAQQKRKEWQPQGQQGYGAARANLTYSEQHRALRIALAGHDIRYSPHHQTLTVNSQKFSTSNGPLYIFVQKGGLAVAVEGSDELTFPNTKQ